MNTETVSVAILKQNLSEYLRHVEQGNEVLVTSHRRPVARLVSENRANSAVCTPVSPLNILRKIRGIRQKQPSSAMQDLINDRQSR